MKDTNIINCESKKHQAAQNAREGLINVNDLSLLTGIPNTQLTRFAKIGHLNHYGEYHGKRFFNFEEIVNWLQEEPGFGEETKAILRANMEAQMKTADCPYDIEVVSTGETTRAKIVWRDCPSHPVAAATAIAA